MSDENTLAKVIGLGLILSAVYNYSPFNAPRNDAFYYPAGVSGPYEIKTNVGTVEDCRTWVYQRAAAHRDPNLTRGDYECGMGFSHMRDGNYVYKDTVR